MVLEKFIVTVIVGDWIVGSKEEHYTLFASSLREAKEYAYEQYGFENVKSVERGVSRCED